MELDYDAVIIGGGFGGVFALQNMKKLGFTAHLFEAGAALGGIWYWNCYPGARVDTEVPVYQLPDEELFKDFHWDEKYPGRDALRQYFNHVTKVWDLDKSISYNSRVTAAHWDAENSRWQVKVAQMQLNGPTEIVRYARSLIVATGFASAPFYPTIPSMDKYRGLHYHTSAWPQNDINMEGKRVAVIGTGASGVQVIQTIAPQVKSLTVYQRTPNFALPMGNNKLPKERLRYYRKNYPELMEKMNTTFAGFMYDFNPGECMKASPEEREALFEELYNKGGLHFWLGTYQDVLKDKRANDMAYTFWRNKTLARVKDKKKAEILAPEVPPHPYGTKRVSLEQNYFDIFNQDNVDIIDIKKNPIKEMTATGIVNEDGTEKDFDLIVYATGFDAISGGIKQINIHGEDDITISEKWSKGTWSHLGMCVRKFPNMFIIYGPQAPTAFVTGGLNAKVQGKWIGEAMSYLRDNDKKFMQPTEEAEVAWHDHVDEVAKMGLFSETESWYFGDNIPGKPREALNYMGGMQAYKQKMKESGPENGMAGFDVA